MGMSNIVKMNFPGINTNKNQLTEDVTQKFSKSSSIKLVD